MEQQVTLEWMRVRSQSDSRTPLEGHENGICDADGQSQAMQIQQIDSHPDLLCLVQLQVVLLSTCCQWPRLEMAERARAHQPLKYCIREWLLVLCAVRVTGFVMSRLLTGCCETNAALARARLRGRTIVV
jgi:hypothetical protein